MSRFLECLKVQRWDDHRYYHHSRINQSLHLVSAMSFVCAYVVAFKDPAMAALLGWLLAMTSRQVGHLVFEPKTYDVINQATHEFKEAIKVGYNLRRKIVLLTIWALSPLLLWWDPTLLHTVRPPGPLAISGGASVISGWPWAAPDWHSARCSSSSSATCKPGWCGQRRS